MEIQLANGAYARRREATMAAKSSTAAAQSVGENRTSCRAPKTRHHPQATPLVSRFLHFILPGQRWRICPRRLSKNRRHTAYCADRSRRTPTGLISHITDKSPLRPDVPRLDASYQYDRLYQLTEANIKPSANVDDHSVFSYSYDAIQNLTSRSYRLGADNTKHHLVFSQPSTFLLLEAPYRPGTANSWMPIGWVRKSSTTLFRPFWNSFVPDTIKIPNMVESDRERLLVKPQHLVSTRAKWIPPLVPLLVKILDERL